MKTVVSVLPCRRRSIATVITSYLFTANCTHLDVKTCGGGSRKFARASIGGIRHGAIWVSREKPLQVFFLTSQKMGKIIDAPACSYCTKQCLEHTESPCQGWFSVCVNAPSSLYCRERTRNVFVLRCIVYVWTLLYIPLDHRLITCADTYDCKLTTQWSFVTVNACTYRYNNVITA